MASTEDCVFQLPTATMVAGNRLTVIDGCLIVLTGVSSRTADYVCNRTHAERANYVLIKKESDKLDSTLGNKEKIHGNFHQVISMTSHVKEGVVVTGSDGCVSATGRIVPHGGADPTDVKTAYIHFHSYGSHDNGKPGAFLLLPVMRSASASDSGFVCPINAGQSIVSVLSANESPSTVKVKEVNVDDSTSESAWEHLWFVGSASGARRLYVMPVDGRKLYMAADGAGNIFLTEDEGPHAPNEGEENPQTHWRFFWKYHDGNDS